MVRYVSQAVIVLWFSCEVGGLRPVPWQSVGASSVPKESESSFEIQRLLLKLPGCRVALCHTQVCFAGKSCSFFSSSSFSSPHLLKSCSAIHCLVWGLEIHSSSEAERDPVGLMALFSGVALWRAVLTPTGLQQMCIALKLGAHQVGSIGGNQVFSSEHCLLI